MTKFSRLVFPRFASYFHNEGTDFLTDTALKLQNNLFLFSCFFTLSMVLKIFMYTYLSVILSIVNGILNYFLFYFKQRRHKCYDGLQRREARPNPFFINMKNCQLGKTVLLIRCWKIDKNSEKNWRNQVHENWKKIKVLHEKFAIWDKNLPKKS